MGKRRPLTVPMISLLRHIEKGGTRPRWKDHGSTVASCLDRGLLLRGSSGTVSLSQLGSVTIEMYRRALV